MIILDSVCKLRDAVSFTKPKGYVQIFEHNKRTNCFKLLNGGNNHIVYTGREWLPQRVFNVNRDPAIHANEWSVYWFGLGTGGATMDDPFNPLEVQLTDEELVNPIVIDASNPTYADGGKKAPFDDVQILQDPDENNKYLLAQIDITITAATGDKVNECGLYISESHEPTATTFVLFARYTFSTVELTDDRDILFRWKVWF